MKPKGPDSFDPHWLTINDIPTQSAAGDVAELNRKQLAWYLNFDHQYAAYLAKQRDKAPRAWTQIDTKPFSLFKSWDETASLRSRGIAPADESSRTHRTAK